MIQGKEIDIDSFKGSKIVRKYPYIELLSFNETLPLVLSSLEKGGLQVQATHKGVTKIIGSISYSAYNIDRLIRTGQQLRVWTSSNDSVQITSILDYLEVI